MKKEAGAKKEDCPATNSAFNGIREYQSHVQDGRGEGKPNDCSNREGGKTGVLNGDKGSPRVEEVRDGSLLGGRLGQQAICCPDPESKSSSSQRRQRGVESKPFFSTLSSITKWRVLL